MSSESKAEKNICVVCGSDIDTIDNDVNCPVCEDRYFIKIKDSYGQNLEKFNSLSTDLFKLYFELSEDFSKSIYQISNQYLELEKNLRLYNPTWYYFLTSYQFLRNLFLENTIQDFSSFYSVCMDMWKTSHLAISQNIVSVLENMNEFCKMINVEEKPSLSKTNKNLIKMISDTNRMYDVYQKNKKPDKLEKLNSNKKIVEH